MVILQISILLLGATAFALPQDLGEDGKMVNEDFGEKGRPPRLRSTAEGCAYRTTNFSAAQLYGNDGAGYADSWKACGTKCTNIKKCDVWKYREATGSCTTSSYNRDNNKLFASRGDYIIGRSGCPGTDHSPGLSSTAVGCTYRNTNFDGAQLGGDDGAGYVKSWKACGTKCTNIKDCDVWKWSEATGWCWTMYDYGSGDFIIGRSGCPETG